MRYICSLLFLLNVFSLFSQKISRDTYLGVHDYIYVEKEPKPLNYDDVRRQIGYPVKALKAGVEGNIYCRVLVNEQGEYVDHIITRKGHPLLIDAVHGHITKLQFIPASRNGQKLPYWVNVRFVFSNHESKSRFWKRQNNTNMSVVQVLGGLRRSREYLSKGLAQIEEGGFLQAIASFEKAIMANPNSLRSTPNAQQVLFSAYYGKARAEMSSNLWDAALESLTDGISVERVLLDLDTVEFEKSHTSQIYIDRAIVFLRQGEKIRALDDINWVLKRAPSHQLQSRALAYRGLIHLKLGQIQDAFLDIQEAIDLAPNSGQAYYFKALVLIHLDGVQAALPLLEQAIVLDLPDDDLEVAESLLMKYSQLQE